jgi:hypothetical protein
MLPAPLAVALTLLREAVRALAFPLHALAYLLRRETAQRRSRELLAHWLTADDGDALEQFRRRMVRSGSGRPHVFLSAGEASGEAHATRLLRAVAASSPVPVCFTCFGGPELAAAGGDVIVPLSRHAIMGLSGVLKALPFLIGVHVRFLRLLRQDRPDLVVLVDYPGLHLVMARAARAAGVRVLHYIAPQ